ncbi:MAG TPA: tetratricopeptide repeat protein [Candidatus Sabulitectum sp.]|nr:tetratricopeptide repeat protein [Candidatus Sabulitectum sp.]HPF32265.1 tetratricopeptide repeat protein [Candidatus Sabulitectum sp.]
MADKPKELTTEQLLIELGRVVMGLGTKIDALGSKLDAIHETLSTAPPAETGASAALDLQPILEKLDLIHGALSGERDTSGGGAEAAVQVDLQPVLEKMEEIRETLGAASGKGEAAAASQVDMTPVTERLEEIRTALEKGSYPEELKKDLQELSNAVKDIPLPSLEGIEEKFQKVADTLDEVKKAAEDRTFAQELGGSLEKVREGLEASGKDTVAAIGEIPGKLDAMGERIAGSMEELQTRTREILEKAEESLEKTEGSLEDVKNELQKGLKLNTDMTGQMVELTSRFADRAQEDLITDLNSRAVEHFNNGEYKEAKALFDEALEQQPDNPDLLCNSANVLAAMDDLEGAEKLFRKALGESPELEPALSGLGMIMVRTARAEETIQFLKSTILSGEPSVRTTIAYARALVALERHDEAVELLETALKGAPDNPEIKAELAEYGCEED